MRSSRVRPRLAVHYNGHIAVQRIVICYAAVILGFFVYLGNKKPLPKSTHENDKKTTFFIFRSQRREESSCRYRVPVPGQRIFSVWFVFDVKNYKSITTSRCTILSVFICKLLQLTYGLTGLGCIIL